MDPDLSIDITGTKPKTLVEEAWHNEQKRKQYDIIRVKNPTNKDFYVEYDLNQHQKFPANSTLDVPRYIAERFIVHMKDEIINNMAQKKHDEQLNERRTKGMPEFTSKYEENVATYNAANYPKTNDATIMEPIISELWIGLVHEFGRDKLPTAIDPRAGEVDLTPVEQKIMEKLNERKVIDDIPSPVMSIQTPNIVPVISKTNFEALNDKLDISEVTQ